MQQVLRQTPATVSQSWYLDGTLTDPSTVTVTITNLAGTALVTNGVTTGTGAAARTFPLTTTHTAELDTLTAVWTSSTLGVLRETYEIVGDLLFTEAEARAFKPPSGVTGMISDGTKYPDSVIIAGRGVIDDDFLQILNFSPYPRYKRVTLNGDGSRCLLLSDYFVTSIREAAYLESDNTTWTALTADELADLAVQDSGELHRRALGIWPWGRRNIRVGYEYGYPKTPAPIKQAALLELTGGGGNSIVKSDIDSRAISFSDGVGTVRLLTPGIGASPVWVSEPTANRILRDFRRPRIAVG